MSDSRLADHFSEQGSLARLLDGFRPRPGQLDLSEAIAECLDDGQDLVAEAATGTGKTLAYLLPVLERDARSILSTGTLNLQEQLFHRDLPLALKATGRECRIALLKGRANYLCPQRLHQHLDSISELDESVVAELRLVERWAEHTRSGEISELAEIGSRSPVWPLVTSTQDNCLGSDCPMLRDCPVAHARRQAQEADVVVVNHHLLFADLALKQSGFGEVLPGAEAVIIDEAHQVPDTAMRFFSRGVSAWQLRELARDSLAACHGAAGSLKLLQVPIAEMKSRLDQAISACVDLPPRGEFGRLRQQLPAFEELARSLSALRQALDPLGEQSRDLANCADRAELLHDGLAGFLAGQDGHVRWFSSRRGRFTLNLTPLDVATPLKQLRETHPATWIMTSATLAVGDRFDHFTSRLGLEDARTLVVDSPFDYPTQTRLWIPKALPEPNHPEHTEALLDSVLPLLRANGGRAFLLFTSHRALQRAAQWMRSNTDFNLLIQEEAPRPVLLERFVHTPRSVLLGAASFWEGVDVPGDDLTLVVIDKLPFAAPDDPVLEATLKAAREAGGNPFTDIQLPQAVLSLKQGAGRLIRQADDFGVLVLGDVRLATRPYGRLFIKSLPPMTRVESGEEAARFLRDRLTMREMAD
ncbi:ATP-dependent DNA helicase [Wenzhouxiangella marina]|uniref:DNA 5'-3' helicase n=1 Tax=Wenzhouxiangella marina TaxID=1579979 RepID=A0A0K0XTG5_9GAMM|nr:ATP-dependent DNA helicase [Wenzhouxiangella marina]AKS41004.1 DNA helicase, Rad3 [Wenzhouxiangella marina]MBB6087881.1 ATP-dependent DNA helicase DinG [Wenzhouxiangella marina]